MPGRPEKIDGSDPIHWTVSKRLFIIFMRSVIPLRTVRQGSYSTKRPISGAGGVFSGDGVRALHYALPKKWSFVPKI
jgi:hypothetical protein